MKSVCIAFAHGCPRAQVDSARFFDYFEANGWVVADSFEQADVILVTCCAFDTATEDAGIRLLKVADRRRKADSELVVVGCMGGISEERLNRELNVTLVPSRNNAALDDIIQASVRFEDVPDPNVIEPAVERASRCFNEAERHADDGRVKALARRAVVRSGIRSRLVALGWKEDFSHLFPTEGVCSIRIAHGCMGECAYCAIRFAAGPLHSKPLAGVLSEFDAGLRQGCTEFKLIAGDVGAYGQDLGTSIVDLLAGIMERPTEFKLSVLDFNIRWLVKYRAELIDMLSRNQSRIRFLSFPVESGSERILELMKRGHTASDAKDVLCALRSACPGLFLETQVVVGFPGETEQDFQDTVELLRAVGFDRVDMFDYSDRPKAEASRMPDKVPRDVIRARSTRLRREFAGRWASLEYAAKDWGRRTAS